MKVLQVTTVATTLNAFLIPFAKAFKEQGWQVDAAADDIDNFPLVKAEHERCFNIKFSRTPLNFFKVYQSFRGIRNLLRSQQYDVVHVHTPVAAFLTRLAAIGLKGTKVFYTAHGFHYVKGNPILKNTIFLMLEKFAGYFTDHLFVINKDDYKLAKRFRFVDEKNLTFIHGIGVSSQEYCFQQEVRVKIRETLNVSFDDFVLLHIAEINKNKNHKVILNALVNLKKQKKIQPFKYFIIGKGKEEEKLKQLVKENDLKEHVFFLGYRENVPDLLCAADAITLSSLREGLPRCMLEAMCYKLPIVASNIRGCNDLLEDGAGVLVEPNDTQGWADALIALLADTNRENMGQRGYDLVTNEYSLESVVELVISVYRKV